MKTSENPVLSAIQSAQPVNKLGEIDQWADQRTGDFCILDGRMCFMRKSTDRKTGAINENPTPLTHNFIALIDEQINLDDGARQETAFIIKGKQRHGPLLPTLTITAANYQPMQWPLRHYGGRGIVEADQATPRKLANAILILSGDIPITTVYQHTGWRQIEKQWCYLSGGGAISESGLNADVQVKLGDGHMSRYRLPAPSDSPAKVAGVLFDLIRVTPNNPGAGVSLFCAVVRAVLGECLPTDYVLFFSGQSGAQKSELAALGQACFGDFDARSLPGNFKDTESVGELKLYRIKDGVTVIDDDSPPANQAEAAKLQTKKDGWFRGAGNQQGRDRCTADMGVKSAYFPRGQIIATGEDVPRGVSLLGRMLVIDIKRGDVDLSILTGLQAMSKNGEFSLAMATFIQWLAPRMTTLKRSFPEMVRAGRDKALADGIATSHPRAADIYAQLYAAADIYIEFANDVGAINSHHSERLMEEIDAALGLAMQAQAQYQKQTDEVERFKSLLRACFASGECHVNCSRDQGPPNTHAFAWGWRKVNHGADIVGVGQLIGWVDADKKQLLLQPEATFKIIQKFASTQGDPMLMQKATLWKRLLEKGELDAFEANKSSGAKRPDIKRGIGNKNKWHFTNTKTGEHFSNTFDEGSIPTVKPDETIEQDLKRRRVLVFKSALILSEHDARDSEWAEHE